MPGLHFPDLHIHTHCSDDGDHSPEDLIAMAQGLHLDMVAFTDHDSVAGTPATSAPGVRILPAVEISSAFCGAEVHILAYGIDPDSPTLRSIIEANDGHRLRQFQRRLDSMKSLGFQVNAEVAAAAAGGRPPKTGALLAMLHHLNPSDERLSAYGTPERPDWGSFYRDFFSPTGTASSPLQAIPPAEVVRLVTQMHAVPVLAHPGALLQYTDPDALVQLIRSLRDGGLDALEAYTSWHSREEAEDFCQLARDLGLGVTAGSDYHGPTCKPEVKLGDPRWTPRDVRHEVYRTYLPRCLD